MTCGRRTVGTIYRRTRTDENGRKRQRAEVRFDDTAGCLRTPAGGSSRQTILVVEGKTVRSRLLSPREAARLMGLSDDYRLPERYNDAYHVCGDGVCVPVVRHIASRLLEPLLRAHGALRAPGRRVAHGDRIPFQIRSRGMALSCDRFGTADIAPIAFVDVPGEPFGIVVRLRGATGTKAVAFGEFDSAREGQRL